MQRQLTIFLFLIAQLVLGQDNQYVKIPGTAYSLIPPDGFKLSSNFAGFENLRNGASIMVNDLPAPYQQIVNAWTPEALKTKGMDLTSKEIVDINNSKVTLFHVTQSANGTQYLKQILVFGNENKTVIVNGIYPESSKDIEASVKKSILTIKQEATLNSNPEESVKFTIDVSGTGFTFTKNMSGTLLYTMDSLMPSDRPTLLAGNSFGNIITENKQDYAEERLKKIPGAVNIEIKSSTRITIDNLQGYEIIAEDQIGSDSILLYEIILFDNTEYYIIIGKAKQKSNLLEIYKKTAKTFKRK